MAERPIPIPEKVKAQLNVLQTLRNAGEATRGPLPDEFLKQMHRVQQAAMARRQQPK